jgi:choline dehydrogenase
MRSLEKYTPHDTIANPTQRGFFGPISVTQNPPVDSELADAMADVAGAPLVSDYNNALLSNVSTGAVQQFVTAGENNRRSFSAYDFTPIGEIIDNKGRGLNGRKLRVMGNAVVSRILFDGNKAIGVQYLRNHGSKKSEQIKKVYAREKIILCAGAINSPKILMLSGIGDAAMLENLGIDVVVNNPYVGANLQNQYGAIARLEDIEPMRHIPGGSILSFIDERPYMPADNIRRMQLIGVDLPEETIIAGFLMQPKSRGLVTITSKDPLIPAKIDMNMYTDGTYADVGSDAYLVVSFFKIVRDIAAAADHEVVYPTPEQYESDEALFAAGLNASSLSITYHTVGTTRMGTSLENGVVDGNLNVFGVENLMVADIGIEPIIVSGNTCYSAYIIGLVAAQILGVATPPVL